MTISSISITSDSLRQLKSVVSIFIDLIIRIIIARGYTKFQNSNILTASKLLKSARDLLKLIPESLDQSFARSQYIETNSEVRFGAPYFSKEILK